MPGATHRPTYPGTSHRPNPKTCARASSGTSARTQLIALVPPTTRSIRRPANNNQLRCDIREMFRRPSLGAAVRCPRRHDDERPHSVPSPRAEQLARSANLVLRDDELKFRAALDAKPIHQPAVTRLMNAYRRARHRSRQQPIPRIGRVTPSLPNARALDQPRRRKRVREQHADVRAPGTQLRNDAAARATTIGQATRERRPRLRAASSRRALQPTSARQQADANVESAPEIADGRQRRRPHHRASWRNRRRRSTSLVMKPVQRGAGSWSRHRRCIQSQRCGSRRTYISRTSVQRCVNSRIASGPFVSGAGTGQSKTRR